MPIGGGGCPSRNPPRSSPTPWRAPSGTSSPPAARDHLSVCGEQSVCVPWMTFLKGTSPRVRGAVGRPVISVAVDGIIPARAGNMAPTWSRARFTRDHPRACGEQGDGNTPGLTHPGSSPRVRGAGLRPGRDRPLRGIIPACAGSSSRPSRRAQAGRDHPRVCGEQRMHSSLWMNWSGSSPLVRGAVHEVGRVAQAHGIIPARAGSRL